MKVKVVFPNGYENEIDADLAQRMVNKGECQFAQTVQPEVKIQQPAKVEAEKDEEKKPVRIKASR